MSELHNREAERIVLGAMMLSRAAIDDVREQLSEADFYDPRHATVFATILANADAGAETGAVGIQIALHQYGELQRIGGSPYLHDLIAAVPVAASAGYYALEVSRLAFARRAREYAVHLGQAADSGDADKITDALERAVAITSRPRAQLPVGGSELDAFLGEEPEPHDWLVPGLIERGDRIILTGGEGKGKSTLLRQLGVQLASGIHPFGGPSFEPLRVLLLDLENSRRQIRRKLYPIRAAAGRRYGGGMVVEPMPEGINLLARTGADLFAAIADRHKPDVLITGPAYKMAAGDPNDEAPAREVAAHLDRLRTQLHCAMFLEAHSPHAAAGGKRPTRPYGASLWLRWPEFGLHLADDGALLHWRGARDERDWPPMLQRGGEWPWTVVAGERDVVWIRIRELCFNAGGQLTERDLADMLGVHKSTVHRAIQAHRAEWDALEVAEVPA